MENEIISYKKNLDFFETLLDNRMKELGFKGIPKYEERLKEEKELIINADLVDYFLIIYDILNWCKKNNILTGLARGSAAGSFLMYLLGIVKINPFDYNLFFSRFLNAGRVAQVLEQLEFEDGSKTEFLPRIKIPQGGDRILAKYYEGDILNNKKIVKKNKEYKGHISLPDVDMDISDRDKVKKYIIKKYGENQFALLGSYNTFKIKAAIKDLNRVVGSNLDYATINVLTNTLFFKEGLDANFEELFKVAQNNSMLYKFCQENPKIVNAMYWLLDTPKSSSVHPCGTLSIPSDENIFTDFPLLEQNDEIMIQWTGAEADGLGFVKNDLLGLSQLTFFEDILRLIKEKENINLDIYNVPLDDEKVYEYLSKGWNSEVFQFNSYLLINYCKMLLPKNIMDLAAAVAAVRPGPMNNGLDKKYVKRKNGLEEITYKFGYEKATQETYGVLLFQEQIMQLASYLGNLNLVEADNLRKCLTKNNYIWTNEGYKLIGDIVNKKDFLTYTLDISSRKIIQENCEEVFSQNQIKKCLRLEFNNGNYIECSEDHKLYTLEGFKEAKDITKKDILITSVITKKENKNSIVLREDELYLICCLVTNGYLIKDSCQFTTADENVRQKYKECIYSYLGKDTIIHEYQDKNKVWQIFVNKIQDKLFLERVKSDKKKLPEKCMNLNREQTLQMLGYLFDLDGSIFITKKKNINSYQLNINYTSNSYYLINQIAILIKSFGIKTYCSLDKRDSKSRNLSLKNNYNVNKFFNIILNYSKKAKNLSEKKEFINLKEYFFNFEDSESVQLPNELISFLYSLNSYQKKEIGLSNHYALKQKRWNKYQLKETIKKYNLKQFEYLISDDIQYINLINKVNIGNQNVFEYSMENTERPYAFINEILISNCLGKKKMAEMLKFHDKIKPIALEKGCSDKEFEDIWSELIEFAKYAFNKSHAVAYAITGYISQWLKIHYPIEFWTAAFQKANDSSDRKERFNQYFKELKDSNSNIKVVTPEINTASNRTTFNEENIYFPLNNIKYLSDNGVEEIIKIRKQYGDFYSFDEFLSRLGTEKLLNKREFENLILSGAFDKIENIKKPIERKRLIIKLLAFLKKDYYRDFLTEKFQEEELWWELKQMELVGVDSINFNSLCNKYFQKYVFFTTYTKLEEGQRANFGGIIYDYIERKSKKKGEYFGCVTLTCKNIEYELMVWPNEWQKYKEKIIQYKGQVMLFETEFTLNKQNNNLQMVLLDSNEPIFLGSDGTKLEKPKAISFKKGDFVKLENGTIGKIIKYPSNSAISIQLKDETVKVCTKWDFVAVVDNY